MGPRAISLLKQTKATTTTNHMWRGCCRQKGPTHYVTTNLCHQQRSIFSGLFGAGDEKDSKNSSQKTEAPNLSSSSAAVPVGTVVSDAMKRRPFPQGVDASKGAFIGNYPADGAELDVADFHNNVPIVRNTATVVEVSKLLAKYDVGCVPVLDSDNSLVGMISERDLARWIGRVISQDGTFPKATAQQLMSPNVVKCHTDTCLSEALRLMYKHNFRHLPIVEKGPDGDLVGLLSMRDIITLEQRGSDAAASDVDDFMKWVLRMSS